MRITPEAVNLAEKFIRCDAMSKALSRQVRANHLDHMLHDVSFRTAELILENQSVCRDHKKWASRVLPCIAFFETMITETGSRESALMFFESWTQSACTPRSILSRIPLLRKLQRHDANNTRIADSSKQPVSCSRSAECVCVSLCRKYGCPEITRFLCACCADSRKYAASAASRGAAQYQDVRLMSKE